MESENESDVDSTDNLDEDRRHAKLIEEIRKLDKKASGSKYQVEQRSEPATQVSEFHLAQGGREYVRLHELMIPLKKSRKYETLKKQLKSINRRKATLPTPLPKPQAEKIQRGIAYGKVTTELAKWDSVVEANRNAEQLVFPLKQPDLRIPPSVEFVKRFQLKTPLEMEVTKLLQQSDHVVESGKELSKAEQLAMKAMSIEEAQECHRQLQKMRALASYQEAKARRQNKIKSKRYHRILKRERIRKSLKEFEELKKTNPELAAEKLKDLDKQRIEERMTLKHKSTGKWAKQQKLRAKYDDAAREALNRQLEMNKQLTAKAVAFSDSDEEEETTARNKGSTSAQDRFFAPQSYNPWLVDSTQQRKTDANDERTGSTSDERRSNVIVIEAENNDDVEEEITQSISISNNETEEISHANGTNDIDGRKVILLSRNGENQDEGKRDDKIERLQRQKGKRNKRKKVTFKESESSTKVHKATMKHTDIKDDEENKEEPQIVESLTRRQTMEDFDNMDEEDEEKDTWEDSAFKEIPLMETSNQAVHKDENKQTQDEKVEIDPTKFITLKTKVLKSAVPSVVTPGEDTFEDEEQRMLIAEAFAEENVIEEFVAEKEAAEESNEPQSFNLSLPGWGSWAGPGIEPKQRKKQLMHTKPQNPRKRQSQPGNVIYSQKENEKLKKLMVKDLPYPYASVKHFESSIRQPIGATWNPESVFRKLTKPSVVTKLGQIIDPIDSDALLKNEPERKQPVSGKSTPIVIPL